MMMVANMAAKQRRREEGGFNHARVKSNSKYDRSIFLPNVKPRYSPPGRGFHVIFVFCDRAGVLSNMKITQDVPARGYMP